MSTPQSRSSPTFYRDELKTALEEQSFGIDSYSILHSTVYDASARVTLLEGIDVDVILSIQGYQAVKDGAATMPVESIEALLEQQSRKYTAKRAEKLTETIYERLMS